MWIDMKEKIIVWIDNNFMQFCLCYYLQKEIDADFYAIIDVPHNTRSFFEHQNIVKFKKVWYYHNHTLPIKNPDLQYLASFEKNNKIDLWKLAINERIFYNYNDFYNFSENEILSILENECKFFESVLREINPDHVIMHEPYFHQDQLFCELSKSNNHNVMLFFFSDVGYRCEIAKKVQYSDNISDIKEKESHRSFEELLKYHHSRNDQKRIHRQNVDPFGNKKNIFNASIEYMFKSKNPSIKTHYSYFGHTKFKTIINALSKSLKTRLRQKYIDKNLIKNADFSKKFIYYPLHIEQERSTLIETPFFTSEIDFIRNIAKSIPIDHVLYVKEHPSQITRQWRTREFYDEIKKIPNVYVIHPYSSSEDLMKNCSLVITLSGTSGYEAAFYQKPSILGADYDWAVLPSVERLESIQELPKLIQKCLEKEVDPKSLDEFITFKENNTFEFYGAQFHELYAKKFFHGGRLADVKITDEVMMEFLAENKSNLELFVKAFVKKINDYKREENF